MANQRYVDSCPLSKEEFSISANRLNCSLDKFGRSQYVCAPLENKSALVEFCYGLTVGLYQKGNCLISVGNGFLDQVFCQNFTEDCPQESFRSTDLYKFPACQEINPQEKCFVADPFCPNTTQWVSTTDRGYNDSSPLAAIIGIPIAIFFVIAFVILVLCFKFNLMKKKRGRHINDTDEEEQVRFIPIRERRPRELVVLNADPRFTTGNMKKASEDRRKIQESEEKEKMLSYLLGDYSEWKTKLSEKFENLKDDELCMLVCFLCSDTGAPDFTDSSWLEIFNKILHKLNKGDPLTKDEALKTLDKLKSSEFLYADQDGVHITEDAADEIMYVFVEYSFVRSDFNIYYPSFKTTKKYTRSQGYKRKPGEKCAICLSSGIETIIIYRLQMDIITHVTMEDKAIHHKVFQILNIPDRISKQGIIEREEFLIDLQKRGEAVHYKRESLEHARQVKWHPRFWRPDLARSSIGLHPHSDIYIINNRAYRKPSKYHECSEDVRSLLYCILFMNKYTVEDRDDSFRILLKKIREKYFADLASPVDATLSHLTTNVTKTQAGLTFASEDIRHDVMYAFVTECLLEDDDLEFFLSEASCDVISEYCRSWEYERSEGERCLYIPYRPEKMINALIAKLQMNIINHCTISDENVHDSICEQLHVPREVLFWDQKARKRYVEYAERGTQTVHHARGMIVGCAGAGKTTLLKRLLQCSEDEIMNVESTEGLDVHEEIFEICEETKSLKATSMRSAYSEEERPSKTLTFFDFGGQCVYYACHQIYLTRRAFYLLVLDASKSLDEEVDGNVCDQNGRLFSGWTYGDYFEFWIKSIHTYYGTGKEIASRPMVLIVATHWEDAKYKSQEEFIESLQRKIPENSYLLQYVKKGGCFFIQFPLTPLKALEERIVEIASHGRWKENIPKDWAFFEIEISQRKAGTKILDLSHVLTKATGNAEAEEYEQEDEKKDMLRYFHDAGKVLFFNENGLERSVIIDVQWFVNIFKSIITDKLHLKGIAATRLDWDDYYNTGCLKKEVLEEIFRQKDEKLRERLAKTGRNENVKTHSSSPQNPVFQKSDKTVYFIRDESQVTEVNNVHQSSPYLLKNLDTILNFMQRLGLVAIGEKYHYVPCMNRKLFDMNILNMIGDPNSKTSILVFQFEYLPYFLYFRLVVACFSIEGWTVLKNNNTSCLYRNVALFSYIDHVIVIAVTETSIQLQVYLQKDVPNSSLEIVKTRDIQRSVENILKKITTSFHRRVEFVRGFSCRNEKEQYITMEMERHFIPRKELRIDNKVNCPLHQLEGRHIVNTTELTRYWNIDAQ